MVQLEHSITAYYLRHIWNATILVQYYNQQHPLTIISQQTLTYSFLLEFDDLLLTIYPALSRIPSMRWQHRL